MWGVWGWDTARGCGDVDGEMSTTHIFMFACCVCLCAALLSSSSMCGDASHVWRWRVVHIHVCVCDWRTHAWECGCGGKLLVLLDQHTHSCPSPPLHLSPCRVVCADVCVHRCVACLTRELTSTFVMRYGSDLGRMGSCVGHNPKHTSTHPHTSSIHTHGSASMLHGCRLRADVCGD